MTSRITTIVLDSTDPERLARFWADVLSWTMKRESESDDWFVVANDDPDSYILLFQKVAESKTIKNRLHLDVNPVGVDQEQEIERLEAIGARRIDIGQGETSWIVLADPEGNEFCLLRRRLES